MHIQSISGESAGQDTHLPHHQDFRLVWLRQVAADRRLVGQAMRVAIAISELVDQATHTARPTQQQIADRLGITSRTVRAAIGALAKRGHLKVTAKRGYAVTNICRLLIEGGRTDV
jgi:biotin operon repressor